MGSTDDSSDGSGSVMIEGASRQIESQNGEEAEETGEAKRHIGSGARVTGGKEHALFRLRWYQ